MPVPSAEKPPEGLDLYWWHVWTHALKVLKEQGTWAWEQRPLLDEYVFALIASVGERDRRPAQWDRHVRRASLLADQLLLTPRSRKAYGIHEDSDAEPSDPFDRLDELAARRSA